MTGHFNSIDKDGRFRVEEKYLKDGVRRSRGTNYNQDGTEEKFDWGW